MFGPRPGQRESSTSHLGAAGNSNPWAIPRPSSASASTTQPTQSNFDTNLFAPFSSSTSTPNNRSTSNGHFSCYRSPSESSQQTGVDNNDLTPLSTPSPTPERNRSQSGLFFADNFGRLHVNNSPNSQGGSPAGGGFFNPDMNGAVPPIRRQAYRYSAVEHERLPVDLPYYNPTFQNTLRSGVEVAKNIASVLQRSAASASDNRLRSISRDAEELSRFRLQAERRVAVVGNTGGGWSQ